MANRRALSISTRSHNFLVPVSAALALAIGACSDDAKPIPDAGPRDDATAAPDATVRDDAEVFPDADVDGGRRDMGVDSGVDGGPNPRAMIFLHTNDTHSHLLGFAPEIDDYPTPVPTTNTTIVGGVKRRAKIIQNLKDEAQMNRTPLALIDAGDTMMGSLYHIGNAAGPRVPAVDYAIMTALQYDVATLGNHEFDFGVDTIATALSTGGITLTGAPGIMRIPFVVSNIHFSIDSTDDDALAALYSPTGGNNRPLRRLEIKTFGTGRAAVRVGFLGLMGMEAALVAPFKQPVKFSLPESATPCTTSADCPGSLCLTPSNDPAAMSGHCAASTSESDPTAVLPAMIADAANVVAELRAQNVDLVVAITHVGINDTEVATLQQMGLSLDNAMYSEEIVLVKGVDMALTRANIPGIDIVIGGHSHSEITTPLEVPNARSGITTYIVQAGDYSRFVGKLRVTQSEFGMPWVIDSAYSGLEKVDAHTAPVDLPTVPELVITGVIEGLMDNLENTIISNPNDGLIYPGEHCDGALIPNNGQCAGIVPGATGGPLTCTLNRQIDLSACVFPGGATCGNAMVEANEMCEGTDFQGRTCQNLGYLPGGALACHTTNCTFDFSGCVPFFPSLLEAALNFQALQDERTLITNDPMVRGDLFFYTLGQTAFDLPSPVAHHESNLLNFITDSARFTLNRSDTSSLMDRVRVMINANGVVRDPIIRGETGALSFSDMFRVMPLGVSPLENTPGFPLVDYWSYAAELKAGLEISVNQGMEASAFWLGVSGARVEYDLSRPENDRITKITLQTLKSDIWNDDALEGTALYDVSRVGMEYRNGPTELLHVATSLYILLFGEALGQCPRDVDGVQYAECRACTTNNDCTAAGTTCNMTEGRCRGGAPVAFRVRSFANINDFGLFQEVKEFLALTHYIRHLPDGGTIPAEYNGAIPRRMCCVGPACTPDRVCN